MAHLTSNTSVEYPCLMCGTLGNIIREGADPRIKCNNQNCNFMYNGSDSAAAVEANAIPEEPPKLKDPTPEPSGPPVGPMPNEAAPYPTSSVDISTLAKGLPRTLKYLIVAKDRLGYEFSNEKQFRKTVLRWEAAGKSYEVFQLTLKKVSANVDIS